MARQRLIALLATPTAALQSSPEHRESLPMTLPYWRRDLHDDRRPRLLARNRIKRALADHRGSLLAFLPGVAEIERTAEALGVSLRTIRNKLREYRERGERVQLLIMEDEDADEES
jgi:hypothetical protein